MKLFKSIGPYLEILVCHQLPGAGNKEPVEGLTYRAYMTDELSNNSTWPTTVEIRTGCYQSYFSPNYQEINITEFRKLTNRMANGLAMQWHQASQIIQPDLWHSFDHYNQPQQTDNV